MLFQFDSVNLEKKIDCDFFLSEQHTHTHRHIHTHTHTHTHIHIYTHTLTYTHTNTHTLDFRVKIFVRGRKGKQTNFFGQFIELFQNWSGSVENCTNMGAS